MAKVIDPDNLTYIVNGTPSNENLRFDTAARTIELVAGGSLTEKDGVTGQCVFSKIKIVLRASAALIAVDVPVLEMIHDESMELVNDWKFKNETTRKMIRDCGIAYIANNGRPTAMFACFTTLGAILAGAPYGTLSSATNASTFDFTHVNIGATFGVNELVQIYSDSNADGTPDYDYRSYAKLFLRVAGYTYDEADNTAIGYPSLTYKKYNFPITHSVDAGVVNDDATVDSALPYTGMSLQWYGSAQSRSLGANGPYNYHVIIDGNAAHKATQAQTYTFVQRQLRKTSDIDAGAGNRTGAVTPALVAMDGTTLKTLHQPGIGGVHVDNVATASFNDISEADDTQAYRSYPYTAALTCEFDSYLVADAGPAKFWVFDEATYGAVGADLIQDADAANIAGNVTAAAMAFSYAWAVDTPVVGIAIGTDGAKIAIAHATLERSTANKLVFVAGQERWYVNP